MNNQKRLFYSNNLRAGPIIQVIPPHKEIVTEGGTVVTTEDGKIIAPENG